MITQEEAQRRFQYLPNGTLTHKLRLSGRRLRGDVVGSLHKSGYIYTTILGKQVAVHRIIFLMHHGHLPPFVDHEDTNKQNNRIENLREATRSQNMRNSNVNKNNSSGVKGVYFKKDAGKWCVNIRANGKLNFLGYYSEIEEAAAVAAAFRKEQHGEFARP